MTADLDEVRRLLAVLADRPFAATLEERTAARDWVEQYDGRQQVARRRSAWYEQAVVQFTWHGGRSFEIDGMPHQARGLGLMLGWAVLAANQFDLPTFAPADVYPGTRRADATALQAIQRASMAPGLPEPLAVALRSIGTRDGVLAVKDEKPTWAVRCASPALVRAVTLPVTSIDP